jgi:TnpA family transposase
LDDNNKQVFAILEGTNREKTLDEIVNAKTDFQDIKNKISNFSKGEYVNLIFAGKRQSLPPAKLTKEMQDELNKICWKKV